MRILPLPALLLLAACHGGSGEPTVARAWVRLPAVAGQPAAAYFTVTGGKDDTLVKIESALAQRVEMHESMAGPSGMTGMTPLAAVALAGPPTEFRPGGRHAMLFGLDPVVKPGTAVPLRFGFSSGKTAEAEAKTVSAGENAPY